MNNPNKFNIGEYVLVNNKYIGNIIKTVWNSNGYIIKLENDDNYIDPTLSQYKLLDHNNILGFMLVTLNDHIEKLNFEQIQNIAINYEQNDQIQTIKTINTKYENFIHNILNISESKKSNLNSDSDSNLELNNIFKPEKFPIYNIEAGQEDNYIKYITKMITDLFINNLHVRWEENFDIVPNSNSIDVLGNENIDDIIKPTLISILEKFIPINNEHYYDFKNTLMYKHLIYDDQIDTLSLGKELITMIKKTLLEFQSEIKLDDEYKLLDSTNLFDFLNFKIVGGYIEISSNYNNNEFRIITEELVPNLTELKFQYSKPIDYNTLTTIVLKNKTSSDVEINKTMIEESLKILSQEYIICFQPKVEILIWTIARLIISWYADPKLFDNIFKIKVLINLFRARGLKEINKDIGIQPIIMIIPKYGKKNATKVLSHLSYFFFPYKKLGWESSKPSWFDSLDNLMYYTNGSLELKKYIKFLLKSKSKFNNPMTQDLTQINTNYIDNKIEYTFPSFQDKQIGLDIDKYNKMTIK